MTINTKSLSQLLYTKHPTMFPLSEENTMFLDRPEIDLANLHGISSFTN